jgi:Tfp pilus assembly protein PilN
MLHTNLSTRPFYNARAVQTVLGVLALIVLAVTLYNVAQIVRLTLQQRSLSARAVLAERDAARLRNEAVGIRARIDPKELNIVAGQAREANAIIDQRTFSWTELFETFEATLPADVRITSIQPRLEQDGSFHVGMVVEAREAEDVDAFVEALENSGTFRNVLPNEEQRNDAGLLEAVIDGAYVAPVPDTAQPVAATGDAPAGDGR